MLSRGIVSICYPLAELFWDLVYITSIAASPDEHAVSML